MGITFEAAYEKAERSARAYDGYVGLMAFTQILEQLEETYGKVFVPKMVVDWDKTLAEAGEDGLTYAGYINALLGVSDESDLLFGGLEYPEGYLDWINGNGCAIDGTLNKIKVINGHVLGFTDVDPRQTRLF